MESTHETSIIRLAHKKDKPTVVKILTETFRNDPHITWLLEQSGHAYKLDIIINYVVDETFSKGMIYLTNDNMGTALWHSEKKEKFNFGFIKRNLSFLFNIGLKSVIRNLDSLKVSHSHFPKNQPFYYLYLVGVLPEAQGKGLARKLLNPVLGTCKLYDIPVFLETANPKNVEMYKKMGFVLTDCFKTNSTLIRFMKIKNNPPRCIPA